MPSQSTQESGSNPAFPSQMRGLLLEEFRTPYVYRTDIPVPTLESGMLLIRVKVAGFCHTDLLAMSGGYNSPLPMIPGHENVGVVAAVGEGVTRFSIGNRVGTLLFRGGCGKCHECLRGTPNYCASVRLAGLDSHGGMAQYLLADPAWTIHIPDGIGFVKAAPLMCAGATVYNSLLRCGVPPAMAGKNGGLVGIMGVGGLGHLAVQFAKAMGYRVVALDTRPAPLELCGRLPEHLRPDLVLNPEETSVEEMLTKIGKEFNDALPPPPTSQSPHKEYLPASGLDAVLVCTDAVPAFTTAIGLLAKHGTLVYVGQPEKPVPMHWSAFITKDLTVVSGCLPCGRWSGVELGGGSGLNSCPPSASGVNQSARWMTARDVMREMMEVVKKSGIHVEVVEYKLQDFGRMMSDFGGENMKGKVVLRIEND